MLNLEKNLIDIIKKALKKTFPEAPDKISEEISLETPKEKKFGDFSVNIAMKLSKDLRKSPMDIAAAIVEHIEKSDIIRDIKVEKPGFINFYISTTRQRILLRILSKKEQSSDLPP
jgi:arginyl-tRNA synthetase